MAVLFVTLGLYGLIAYSVSRRTSELGIRMAIGARSGTIVGMVLRQALRISAAGVTAGLVLAFIFTRALTSLLFQVRPLDPATLAASAALVVLVTLAASYIPARRAGRISPMAALRYE
jgi:putative ABC transport system permease protein